MKDNRGNYGGRGRGGGRGGSRGGGGYRPQLGFTPNSGYRQNKDTSAANRMLGWACTMFKNYTYQICYHTSSYSDIHKRHALVLNFACVHPIVRDALEGGSFMSRLKLFALQA